MDPPPVVELRIFEGKNPADLVDVTFNYNANFFLFTTLEVARPIAHGRMQPQIQQIPVLTGMPVSGMAYLDRPSLAGYFIFPDLSVRHEGRYRLSFNLYEETKEARDADGESSDQTKPSVPSSPTSPSAPTASFDWRLEVKSDPFTVFSAKKFPGLAESTSLSRAVAEQGCRVRIRRDVRMRRRDNKPNTDYEAAQEGEYVRAGRTPSVQESRDRSRSLSNESAGRHPYGLERRLSGEYPGAYAHPSSRPQSYLNFGAPRNQPQAPPHRFAQPAPPAPMPYQSALAPRPHPGQGQYRQPAPSPQDAFARLPHPQSAPPPPQNSLSRLPHPQYAPPPIQPTRRQPDLNPPHLPEIAGQSPSRQNSADIIGTRTEAKGPTLPPMRNLNHQGFIRESRLTLAPINRVISTPKLPAAGPLQADEHETDQLEPDRRVFDRVRSESAYSKSMSKRSHEAAFDSRSNKNIPLHNGMRPEDDGSQTILDDPADPDSARSKPAWMHPMEYQRADGSRHRILNPPSP